MVPELNKEKMIKGKPIRFRISFGVTALKAIHRKAPVTRLEVGSARHTDQNPKINILWQTAFTDLLR